MQKKKTSKIYSTCTHKVNENFILLCIPWTPAYLKQFFLKCGCRKGKFAQTKHYPHFPSLRPKLSEDNFLLLETNSVHSENESLMSLGSSDFGYYTLTVRLRLWKEAFYKLTSFSNYQISLNTVCP